MARAAAQRRKRPKPDARKQRGRGAARPVEETLFFARLRGHAKWVYILLAVVFAATFVFLGVGSGSSGIGDLLQGNFDFFGRSSSGPSVDDAREKIEKNPKDAAAYRELSTALQTEGKNDEAIGALEQYRQLRPKDVGALRELAALYLQKAERFRLRAAQAQVDAGGALAFNDFQPATKIGEALKDPIFDAIVAKANTAFSAAISEEQSAYRSAVGVYQSIAKASPSDPTVQLELAQAAESGGDTQTAIAAYQKFIKLAPDDPSVPAIKQQIKQLQSPALGAVPSG